MIAALAGFAALWAAVAGTLAALASVLALSQLLHNTDILDEQVLATQSRLTTVLAAERQILAVLRDRLDRHR